MCRSFYFFTLRDVVGAIPYKTDSRGRLSLQTGQSGTSVPTNREEIPLPYIFYLFTIHSSLFTLHYSLFTIHSSLFTLRDVGDAIPYRNGQSRTPVPTNWEEIPLPYILPLHYSLFTIHSAGCRGRLSLQKRTVEDACPYKSGGDACPYRKKKRATFFVALFMLIFFCW